jgi:hypothetical protein
MVFFDIIPVLAWMKPTKNLLYLSRDSNTESCEHEAGELPTWPDIWCQSCFIIIILKIMGLPVSGNL